MGHFHFMAFYFLFIVKKVFAKLFNTKDTNVQIAAILKTVVSCLLCFIYMCHNRLLQFYYFNITNVFCVQEV